jgi:branched-chain amino acid transport system substrate-binding protein
LKHLVLISLSFLFVISCSTTSTAPTTRVKKSEPRPASPQIETLFKTAQTQFNKKNYPQALQNLQQLIQQEPDSTLAGEAQYLIGQIHEEQKDSTKAYNAFLSVVQSPYFSSKEFHARYKVAEYLKSREQLDEALGYIESIIKSVNVAKDVLIRTHLLSIDIYIYKQRNIPALLALIELSKLSDAPSSQEAYKMRALDMVNTNLTANDLMQIVGNREFEFVRAAAFYNLGKMFFDQREFSRAASYLESAKSVEPNSRYADLASQILQQIDARSKTEAYTVGAVLPLSGKLAPVGERSLRGLQLGFGVFDKNRSDFKLSVVDSESANDGARAAVERLVVEDNIIALVGSILSKNALEVAEKANDLGVPSLALSQRAGVSDVGPSVFRHALTSKMQVQKLVDTAMNKMKLTRFAIVYPNDAYGIEFANIFWDEVLSRGGQITAAQPYVSGETDFRAVIQRLVGSYYVEDRRDEYNLRLKQWKEKNKNARNSPDDLLPPIVDFEALFIPDNAKALGQIAPMLEFNDVKNMTLLGTNLWNTSSFLQRVGKYGESTIFVDTYTASESSQEKQKFEESYQKIFGDKPDPIVTQSYEVAKILRSLIEKGARSRSSIQESLSKINNFPGVSGALTMSENREIQKPVTVLTVKAGKIVTLE